MPVLSDSDPKTLDHFTCEDPSTNRIPLIKESAPPSSVCTGDLYKRKFKFELSIEDDSQENVEKEKKDVELKLYEICTVDKDKERTLWTRHKILSPYLFGVGVETDKKWYSGYESDGEGVANANGNKIGYLKNKALNPVVGKVPKYLIYHDLI